MCLSSQDGGDTGGAGAEATITKLPLLGQRVEVVFVGMDVSLAKIASLMNGKSTEPGSGNEERKCH